MVYESSTRRIYSSASPRPVISTSYSYSPVGPVPVVTKIRSQPHLVLAYHPGTSKGHIINPIAIPRVAHRRLASVPPPPRRALNGQNYYDMLESGIPGHYNNRIILVKYRPTPTPVPQTKVLYIEDVTDSNSYGKETRLLRRELSPTPSLVYGSPWDTSSAMIPYSRPLYSLHNIPLRSASEMKEIADIRRLYVRDRNPDVGYSPLNKALLYRMPMPHYVDPTLPQSYYIGRGNLACLSFAGGRPIPKRRRFYHDYEDKIRDEVTFRSFYTKLRDAAAVGRSPGKRPVYQPIYYSKKTILGEDNVPKRQPKESKWVERALANEKPPTPRANKPAPAAAATPPTSKPASVATETVVTPPRKESLTMTKTVATPPPVQPINVTLPGPRKSITEYNREDLPKFESLPEEKVTVKMPKEPEPEPPAPVVAEAEQTVIVPSKPEPKEATPPPPAPEEKAEPDAIKEEVAAPEPVAEVTSAPAQVEETPAPAPEVAPVEKVEEVAPVEKAVEPPAPEPVVESPAVEPVKEEAPVIESAPAAPEVPAPPTEQPVTEAPTPVEEPAPVAAVEESPAAPAEAPASPAAEQPAAEAPAESLPEEKSAVEAPIVAEASSEPPSEVSAPAASADHESHDEASNKEGKQPAEPATAVEQPLPEAVDESPKTTEGSSTTEPASDQQDVVPPAPVSIVVADIDGPIPVQEEAPAEQKEPLTVEQIQAEAERRRAEFAQLLEEHAELVTTVTKLERVAVIVSKSCAEAVAQQGT